MPSRNVLKIDAPESYYHIYARGASKKPVFLEPADYIYFEKLLARYLSHKPVISKEGVMYPHLTGHVELLAFCLMKNHFHLLVYQVEMGMMAKLMLSIMTSYSRYFNLKYKQTGSLFETRYKASKIDVHAYLEHISRYIHLNPRSWKNYAYSSLQYYREGSQPEWLLPNRILQMFTTGQAYMAFVADHEDYKEMLEEIKYELADT